MTRTSQRFLRNRRAGFSLIEIMTALAIFSIAAVGIIEGMGVGIRIQGDLVFQQRAAMLAENILEEIKYVGEFEEGTQQGEFEESDAGFAWQTVVSETGIETLVEVTVIISWADGMRSRDFQLATMMSTVGEALPDGEFER